MINRNELNLIKNKTMAAYRYCQRVYNNGIESPAQFNIFKKLCQNHIDYCNFWCNKLKPTLGYIQYNQMKMYKEYYALCELTVLGLASIISEFQAILNKENEEADAIRMIETRARIEHSIAMDMRDKDHDKHLEVFHKRPIGYNIN